MESEDYKNLIPDLQIYHTEMSKEPVLSQIRTDHLNAEEDREIRKLISEFSSIFYQEGTDLSFTNAIKHNIKTINEIPIYTRSYRYTEVHKEEVSRQINAMLNQRIIRPSNSLYSAPIWIVPKKGRI